MPEVGRVDGLMYLNLFDSSDQDNENGKPHVMKVGQVYHGIDGYKQFVGQIYCYERNHFQRVVSKLVQGGSA